MDRARASDQSSGPNGATREATLRSRAAEHKEDYKNMICKPLALHEMAAHRGFTHMAIVTADDLTMATVATLQTITICDLVAGDIIAAIEDNVFVNFKDTSDTAFNTTTRSLGDDSAVTTFTSAGEANANGTVVEEEIQCDSGGALHGREPPKSHV